MSSIASLFAVCGTGPFGGRHGCRSPCVWEYSPREESLKITPRLQVKIGSKGNLQTGRCSEDRVRSSNAHMG